MQNNMQQPRSGSNLEFRLPNGEDVLRNRQMQYEYLKYRERYYEAYHVHPEFDHVHKPACAVVHSQVIYPDDLDNSMKNNTKKGLIQILTTGIRGGLEAVDHGKAPWNRGVSVANDYIPDDTSNLLSIAFGKSSKLYPPFKKAFRQAIEKYKFLYSAVACFEPETVRTMEPCDSFSSPSLGWKKLSTNAYAEGVWEGNNFLYGLLYHPDQGILAGTFDEAGHMIDGIHLDDGVWRIGTFNSEGEFECKNGIVIEQNTNGDLLIRIGDFLHNMENGFFLEFLLENGSAVDMRDVKYDFGEEVKMTFAEKKERKKLYGTSKGDRIMAYYRNIMFLIVAIIFTFSAFSVGFFLFLVALPFWLVGIFGLRSAIRMSKKAKEYNS